MTPYRRENGTRLRFKSEQNFEARGDLALRKQSCAS